jgi:PQQ-dependent catabolism-associated CXXCW motif protein
VNGAQHAVRKAVIGIAAMLAAMTDLGEAVAQQPAEATLFDPVTGYRIARYRGIVCSVPHGVRRIDVVEAHGLWRSGELFIDVNPALGAVRDAESGRWTLAEPHASILGAHWFAESGRGQLFPEREASFLRDVRRLVAARLRWTVVVFCLADCWMSWNAALRLRRAGLGNVRWFADGLDGWKDKGFEVQDASPE